MNLKTLRDLDLNGKTVLLRADLNVPVNDKAVTDTMRIDRLKPTVQYLHEHNAKIIIVSHYGRPMGNVVPELSMEFLVPVLEKRWDKTVKFSKHTIGPKAHEAISSSGPEDIVLLENVRFHQAEKANTDEFSSRLAELADYYVNDAFSTSHRPHSSILGITNFLPSVAGMLMEEELGALTRALTTPKKPLLAVAGGSKISTKLDVLENLIEKVDYLVLGGGMANTFLYANGYAMRKSLCERDMQTTARDIMTKALKIGCKIILPVDVVVVKELKEYADHMIVDIDDMPDDHMAIDIGPKTIELISGYVKKSKTVVWNGPLGVFEMKPFDNGTNEIAKLVAKQTHANECASIAGGGDTVAALENAECSDDFSYVSTAGGAFLEWLEGKELPGITPLLK